MRVLRQRNPSILMVLIESRQIRHCYGLAIGGAHLAVRNCGSSQMHIRSAWMMASKSLARDTCNWGEEAASQPDASPRFTKIFGL